MAIIISTGSVSALAIYTGLVNDIYSITKRPDLISETALAIRAATMKAHQADFWKNDLKELPNIAVPALPVQNVSFRYNLDLTNQVQFPLYRKISHIKEYNATPTGYEIQFKELDADRLLDDYLLEDINYWYQAGMQVSIRCNKALTALLVGYWQYPNVVPAAYNSWIALQFPDIIVSEACAKLFAMIGKDQEARSFAAMFAENLAELRMTQI